MIGKHELLEMANTLRLNAHVVEKDYALGWALAGIAAHREIADSWVFKGCTCLKKCYFETYRFSEDLDFTLQDGAHLDEEFLKRVFAEVAEWVYEQSGLELPAASQDSELYANPRGELNCQGKLSYRGPVSPRSGGLPRIKLDLTADERLVLAPVRMPVFHPYSDAPDGGIAVKVPVKVPGTAQAYKALSSPSVPSPAPRTAPCTRRPPAGAECLASPTPRRSQGACPAPRRSP